MTSLPLPDLALAYELRQEGCTWKRIALGLGCDWKMLKDRIRNLEKSGLQNNLRRHQEPTLHAAMTMRSHNLGWQCIADHLGVDRQSLKWAVNKYRFTQRHMDIALGERRVQ